MNQEKHVIKNNNAFLMAMGDGSRLEIHAADAAKDSWTQLKKTAQAGDKFITLSETTRWEVGDKIAIAASGQAQHHEERTIVGISDDGMTFELDRLLEHDHYGQIDGYNNGLTGGDHREWEVDMRSEVALLSRNVTIQGDEDSVEDGFGAHTMVMNGAQQHISGAEFFRVGQADIIGRYPIHWHMLGDAAGQYAENISVHHSYQKGSTIHGSFNVRYENNVIFDHMGHGVFLEDGSEFGSQILYNLVFGSKSSETGLPIPTDRDQVSSFWIENASVTMIGNHAAGSEEVGIWIIPAHNGAHGLSARAFSEEDFPEVSGGDMNKLVFRDNTTHSNLDAGLRADAIVDHDTLQIVPSVIESGVFQIENHTSYGNLRHGIWLRGADPRIDDAKVVGNRFGIEVHAHSETIISNSLIVGNSNNEAANLRSQHGEVIGTDAGISLYRVSQLGLNGVHFETEQEDHQWAAVRSETGPTEHPTWFNETTFNNVDRMLYWYGSDSQATNRLLDLDGSVTGTPGAFLTQNQSDGSLKERAGFVAKDAGDGFHDTWLNTGGGFAQVFLGRNNKTSFDITRSDGLKYKDFEPGTSTNATFIIATNHDGEAAYLLELEEPENLTLRVDGLRVGQAVVFEIPNVADYQLGRQADSDAPMVVADSFEALFGSETSASYYADDSLFIRVVGVAHNDTIFANVPDLDNPARDFMASEGTAKGYRFSLTPTENIALRGEATFNVEMMEWIDQASGVGGAFDVPDLPELEARAAPERFASTSETVATIDGLSRWSEADTWGGAVPGRGDVVVIDGHQKVVLDTSAEVAGIIINGAGSALIIEDKPGKTINLIADWILVNDGALFQAGTEADPIDTDFTLTLTGDDPNFDLDVEAYLVGMMPATVFAGSGNDILQGGDTADTIDAGAGDDYVHGAHGDDSLTGGPGDDQLQGENGDDTLEGGADNDLLIGGGGSDELLGGDGFDILIGDTRGIYHTDESAQVYRMYAAVFGREPDLNGHQAWTRGLTFGTITLDEVAASFVGSREFQATYGDATHSEFVSLLYQNVLDRAYDAGGLNGWVGLLEGGMARAGVVRRFAESAEHKVATGPNQQAFDAALDPTEWVDDIYRLYHAVLDRDPDANGFAGWVETLSSGGESFDSVVRNFIASAEFQNIYGEANNAEFVTLLYQNVLKRAPDPGGFNSWVTNLEGGTPRETVVGGFMASQEFIQGTEVELRAYINGFGSDDVIDPGVGDAVVSGGLFADTFVFMDDGIASSVEVTDLEVWDTLRFEGFGLSEGDVIDAMSQVGRDVVFVDGSETVIFADTVLADINEEMILIA